MLVPRTFGGAQAKYETYLRVIEEISRHDGSAGWNVMIWAAEGLFADYLSYEVAEHVFGVGKQPVVAGAISPTGRATQVPGGFSVAGRWSFASGCQYATWLIAACVVYDVDGAPVILQWRPRHSDSATAAIIMRDCRHVAFRGFAWNW